MPKGPPQQVLTRGAAARAVAAPAAGIWPGRAASQAEDAQSRILIAEGRGKDALERAKALRVVEA